MERALRGGGAGPNPPAGASPSVRMPSIEGMASSESMTTANRATAHVTAAKGCVATAEAAAMSTTTGMAAALRQELPRRQPEHQRRNQDRALHGPIICPIRLLQYRNCARHKDYRFLLF